MRQVYAIGNWITIFRPSRSCSARLVKARRKTDFFRLFNQKTTYGTPPSYSYDGLLQAPHLCTLILPLYTSSSIVISFNAFLEVHNRALVCLFFIEFVLYVTGFKQSWPYLTLINAAMRLQWTLWLFLPTPKAPNGLVTLSSDVILPIQDQKCLGRVHVPPSLHLSYTWNL